MLPYIQIGPLRLWTYGLMLAWGLWQGYYFFRQEVRRRKLAIDDGALMLAIAIAGVAGAKLYHVIVTMLLTEHQPLTWRNVFDFGGLAWNGGLIAGFAVLAWYAYSKRISIWLLLDAASPAAALGYGFGRLGCFFAGDGDYGKPTNFPWGMSFPNGLVPTTQRVHPTPLYEIFGAVFLFWLLRRMARDPHLPKEGRYGAPNGLVMHAKPGTVFGVYLLVSGAFRFAVEFIRINPPLLFGLTEAQLISVGAMISGVFVLASKRTPALAVAQ
jgi:phosphatidylglycerol:prolipoprotein diacylglycerol transferase